MFCFRLYNYGTPCSIYVILKTQVTVSDLSNVCCIKVHFPVTSFVTIKVNAIEQVTCFKPI